MSDIILKDYFNVTDTSGVTHLGFLQSMVFPAELTTINEVSAAILDNYIFNRFSNAGALNQWKNYMNWNREQKEYKILPDFYNDFAMAAYVEMMRVNKINVGILEYNFKDFSYSEIENITRGAKTTTRDYDNVVVTVTAGQDTQTIGQRSDTIGGGISTTTRDTDTSIDSEMVFDSAAFIDRDKTLNTYGDVQVEDSDRQNVQGSQTNTSKLGDRETETDARKDVEAVSSYIDKIERTKHILISPDKFFEIQKQLADINAYTLLGDAVLKTFHNGLWEVWDGRYY